MAKSKNTEQKIFDAATELFMEKGVDRTSVRDIASKAGINLALMNYYFRSKENLFDTIFTNLVTENTRELLKILNSDMGLEEKIRSYVNAYIDMLTANPLLVPFFMAIIHRSQEKITQMKVISNLYGTEKFSQQIVDEGKKGTIRRTDPSHFFVDMISMITFPFAIRPLIMDRNEMSEEEFNEFIQERKEHVTEVLLKCMMPC
ncbi:MAG: TetR/AcrR family transcriptional regulator [Bacteroidetes bacterium]|nr:MAG: TetR/AcrR family transcriptional regulator [Bacteroidota bacterium]